ncbi:AAA family ATPase [Vagococcus sp. BWB3-3]|uniref:AAA family ATPase n=1 Tax=Vagococcus allomyrinae TaxID=2794353 RepID=A0A940PEV1_9ENTE|nr:UvrD-helicase domain-containing protein [Vagococcus allomyrinae]MBP1042693.1 AAA family ATPase [Vagococcus allomyrinae]
MSKKNEWAIEQDYLTMVYGKLLEMQEKVFNDFDDAELDSRNFLKNLSDDIRINTSSASDSFESLIEVEQKNQELAQLNYKREWLEKQKRNIGQLLEGPYFAKLDVQYPDESEIEQFYIGVAGFSDEDHHQYVYDWRSPIANLYYENNLGPTSYEAPMGQVTVDLKNRRQMKLNKSKLVDFFDTSTAIEDPMLLEVLNEESTAKLTDITSTIQKEQNAIIRDTKSDVLIVEGIAGSGKTSTILQRIAFLLYRYKDDLVPEQVLLLSPNPMFSKYIEEVLPSLGEKNPRQMTYRDLMRNRGRHYEVENLEEQLKNPLVLNSLDNMKAIEEYVADLKPELMDFTPIKRGDELIISTKWMQQTIMSLPKEVELYRKLDYLKEKMNEALAKFIRTESKKPKWRDELENMSNEEYNQLFAKVKKGSEDENIQQVINRLVNRRYSNLKGSINNFSWIDIESHYILATGLRINQPMSLDQATEFAYLYHLMIERRNNRKTKFVILDEVQDYSEAQLYFLSKVYSGSHFTLVGDGYQSIFAQGTSFKRVEEIFQASHRQVKSVQLLKSYRSSGPISHFMKHLLGGEGSGVEVIDRPGKDPEFPQFSSQEAYFEYLNKQLTPAKNGYRKVVLTKDSDEAKRLYRELGEPAEVTLIADSSRMELNVPVLLMPVHLAKGLEFDVVIVHNVSKKRFKDSQDLNLLYTASSRAMHELYLPYVGEPSNYIVPIK